MDAQTPKREIQPIKPTRLLIVGMVGVWLILPRVEAGVTLVSLVSFNQTNGDFPSAGLVQAKDGNFYGTTTFGGSGSYGTVFQMSPSGTFTNLISFDGTNGASPHAGLVQGTDGSFYGTTYAGGTNGYGTIFQLTTSGTLTTLVTFAIGTGGHPIAGLIQGQDGNFYGTTSFGGTNIGGTAFQVMTNGALTTLVSFNVSGNGGNSPCAGLVQANDGCLYGTTELGGTNGCGTIFKLTTNGTFTSLYSFTGTNDGAKPYAGLVQGSDGNFYGTTSAGGAYTNQSGLGYGTVFEFATNGTLTTLVSFGNTNGANPQAGLVQASDGNFYGTTSAGGAYTNQSGFGYGTIFKLATNGTLTTLVSFNGTNGASPQAGLVQGVDGNFYGTTAQGGTNGYGTVFQLSAIVPPPRFKTVTKVGTTLTLTWSATVGQSYQMLYKTNLNQPTWGNLNNSLTATNPIMTTSDATGPDRQRFYRILLLLP
jgi:uncharacterized repeat protein (TIGR03803 family)